MLFFKCGKFYEIFYQDAFICHKEMGLKWMGHRAKVGFPERWLEKNGSLLVAKGYKVTVMEHLERWRDKLKRMEAATEKQSRLGFDKLIGGKGKGKQGNSKLGRSLSQVMAQPVAHNLLKKSSRLAKKGRPRGKSAYRHINPKLLKDDCIKRGLT